MLMHYFTIRQPEFTISIVRCDRMNHVAAAKKVVEETCRVTVALLSHLALRLRWNIEDRTVYRLLYWVFSFYANAGWSTLIESDPQPVIYFSGYNMLLLSWSRWRHNASGFKRSNGLSAARLPLAAQQLLCRTINEAACSCRSESSDEACFAAPPSANVPLLVEEAYLCSYSHEDRKQK